MRRSSSCPHFKDDATEGRWLNLPKVTQLVGSGAGIWTQVSGVNAYSFSHYTKSSKVSPATSWNNEVNIFIRFNSPTLRPFISLNFCLVSAMFILCHLLTALSRPPCLELHNKAVLQDAPVGLPDPNPLFSLLDHIGYGVRTAQERSGFQSFAHLPHLLLEELNEIIM